MGVEIVCNSAYWHGLEILMHTVAGREINLRCCNAQWCWYLPNRSWKIPSSDFPPRACISSALPCIYLLNSAGNYTKWKRFFLCLLSKNKARDHVEEESSPRLMEKE